MKKAIFAIACLGFVLVAIGCKKSVVRKKVLKPEKPYRSFLVYKEPEIER